MAMYAFESSPGVGPLAEERSSDAGVSERPSCARRCAGSKHTSHIGHTGGLAAPRAKRSDKLPIIGVPKKNRGHGTQPHPSDDEGAVTG